MSNTSVRTACWLTINRSCNLRCKWCYARGSGYRVDDTMSVDMASRCLDLAKACGVKTTLLLGGEPLLHQNLLDIIVAAHERDMKVIIISNGLALRDYRLAKSIFSRMREDDELNISLKGFDNEQYYMNTGSLGGFESVKQAVSNTERAGINYSLSFVVSQENVGSLKPGLEFIKTEFDCAIGLSFCSPCFTFKGVEKRLTPTEHARLISKTLSLVSDTRVNVDSAHVNAPLCLISPLQIDSALSFVSLATGCHVLSRSGIVFDTNGNLLLCNHLAMLPVGIMGADYSSAEEFKAFLSDEKVVHAWETFTKLPFEKCGDCDVLLDCGGGCPLLFYD